MLDRPSAPRFVLLLAPLALAACAPPPRPGPASDALPVPPPAGRAVGSYRVRVSDVVVRVYRDGPLAELGHNHVVATTGVQGRIELRDPLPASSFRLALPLDTLVVDDPGRRAEAGADFPDDLTPADREGTRRNLLGPALLDAARFPTLHLESVAIEAGGEGYVATARIDVAGKGRHVRVPATIERKDRDLVISGAFVLTHAELGLEPFSAALGALRVREDMEIAYRLVASEDAS